VPNRSLVERWQKWRRRSPAGLQRMLLFLVVGCGMLAMILAAWFYVGEKTTEAERALAEGQKQWQERHHYTEAIATLQRGLAIAERLPYRSSLVDQLSEQLRLAQHAWTVRERTRLAQDLHRQVDQMRSLFGADLDVGSLRALLIPCQQLWSKRSQLHEVLAPEEYPEAAADLADLGLLHADLVVRVAGSTGEPQARRAALGILDETEELFGGSAVLDYERTRHRRALGMPAPPMSRPAAASPGAWKHYALGRAYLRSGDLERAAEELKQAKRLEPAGCWPNYYLGVCAYRQGNYAAALRSFDVCVGAAHDLAGCFYTRALALSALDETAEALADYNHALRLNPKFTAAWLNRGILHYQAKHYDEALHDLEQALQTGADPATVHYNLALVHQARGERDKAVSCLDRVLAQSPTHPKAAALRQQLQGPR
jgi:tetratricopeptide (TPR) repeat protein